VVSSKNEARRVLLFMSGVHKLTAQLLYGCALRLMECVRLRVKDIDFDQNQIIVRDGKGMKERSTVLAEQLRDILREQIQKVKMVHDQDIKQGGGNVYLPFALDGALISPAGSSSLTANPGLRDLLAVAKLARAKTCRFPA
jgi:integrase